jgi:hypothetical protein
MLCYSQHPPTTQRTPMTDADDINSLQEQLTTHRERLAVLLRQVATHTEAYAPPAQISGIAEARREIARLKAALRDAGDVVEEQVGDVTMVDETTGPVGAPVIASAHAARDVNIATNQTILNVSYLPQPHPTIDPAQAQQRLDRLPLDVIPDLASLPSGSRMQLLRNPLFVGREADLKAIAKNLKDGGAAAITTGIGGVGKTQLASKFAHRYGQFSPVACSGSPSLTRPASTRNRGVRRRGRDGAVYRCSKADPGRASGEGSG